MKISVPKRIAGRNGRRTMPVPIPSPSDFYKSLGLAEIYLDDGATITALQLVREALEIANPSLADSEDLGDVSTHLLQRVSL
jgi:hypothetical protein